MDFEFYNVDPHGGLLARSFRPARRFLRRIQRPYFHRLRDLLQWLFDRQIETSRRQDDFTVHLKMVEDHYKARIDHLERSISHVGGELAAAQREKAVFQTDYLAVTRRLARLEDLLIEVLASQPVTPHEQTGPSLAKIAS